MASRAFPDAEAVLVGWLTEQFPTVWCSTDLPAQVEERLPVCQITRISGTRSHVPFSHVGTGLFDHPRFDVDCYAPRRDQASDLAGQVCAALWTLRNTTTGGVLVTEVAEEVGPSWRPDFNPRVRRFGASYVLTLRPA